MDILIALFFSISTLFNGVYDMPVVQEASAKVWELTHIDQEAKREYEEMIRKYDRVKLEEFSKLSSSIGENYGFSLAQADTENVATETDDTARNILYLDTFHLGDEIQPYLDRIPSQVMDAVIRYGYSMYIVEDVGAGYGMTNICGLTLPEEHKILIQNKAKKFRRAVVHEVGHAYDSVLGWQSDSVGFREIYLAEVGSLVVTGYSSNGHYKCNAQEYFAEAFQEYCFNSDGLKNSVPKTYEFIKNLIES